MLKQTLSVANNLCFVCSFCMLVVSMIKDCTEQVWSKFKHILIVINSR